MNTATRVIKVGGRPQSDPRLPSALTDAWGDPARKVVVVHGGGDEVSALQAAFGASASFVDGRRVTTEADIDLIRMALSGSANKRLVSALAQHGVCAVGVSGEDAALIAASRAADTRLGFVGSPARINTSFIQHLITGGYLPVISPVSQDGDMSAAGALNVNGDDAAAAIAVAMGADELLLVADVEGVMSDGGVVTDLTPATARQLMANGTAAGGMRAKLQAALAAVAGGVSAARISDIAAIGDPTRGTTLRAVGELS